MFAYLKAIAPRHETPKLIAAAIREKPGTVRKELTRMEEKGHVINVHGTGWYRIFLDPSDLHLAERAEPCLHGLQIEAPLPLSGWSPPPRGARQAQLQADNRWVPVVENGSAQRVEWVAGRRVTFQAFGTARLLVGVSATSRPVLCEEWAEFYGELKGILRSMGVEPDSPLVRLVNVEFNVDWENYFLSGVKRLKLQQFGRVWAQVYQKHKDALRYEVRVAPTEISFEEAARAIMYLARGMPAPTVTLQPSGPDPDDPAVR